MDIFYFNYKNDQDKPAKTGSKKNGSNALNGGISDMDNYVFISPTALADALAVYDHIENNHTVVVDLSKADADKSQRITDYLCGAVLALNKNINKLSDYSFIISDDEV